VIVPARRALPLLLPLLLPAACSEEKQTTDSGIGPARAM
jgi:hypothetical protein